MYNDLPLTPKIGQAALNEKFASWSGSYGYYSDHSAITDPYLTDSRSKNKFSLEELNLNEMLCSKQRTCNRSHIVNNKSDKVGFNLPLLSNNNSTYVHHKKMTGILCHDSELLNKIFLYFERRFGAQSKSRSNLLLDRRQINDMIEVCFGEVPDYVTNKVVILCRSNEKNGVVQWHDFCDCIFPALVDVIQRECCLRKESLSSPKLVDNQHLVDDELIAEGETNTTYQSNYNRINKLKFKSSLNKKVSIFIDNPETFNASNLLLKGTVKSTKQIPGYRGHIPYNVRNLKKYDHSQGVSNHPVINNLRLTQKGVGIMLGYTGHISSENDSGERITSCDPRTSNGAAYGCAREFL